MAEHLKELINANVRDERLYAVAILFYGEEQLALQRRGALGAAEQERLKRLRGLTAAMGPLYRQYAGREPEREVIDMLDRLQ